MSTLVTALRSGSRLAITAVVVALLAAFAFGASAVFGQGTHAYTLEFDQTRGLYAGDDVTILGVKVGKITEIDPRPDKVVVTVEVGAEHKIPEDAKAVLVAPSLVAVRHVEITPAYEGGSSLADGDIVPQSRTAIPQEWDDVKEQLVRLTEALGPEGANADGALNDLIDTAATNLEGNGADINATVVELSKAMETLSASGDDLFATVTNLQIFTEALEASDAQVVDFNQRLAAVSEQLNGQGQELAALLDTLSVTFPKVQGFLMDNGEQLTRTLDELRGPAEMFASHRQDMADILQVMPGTLSNFYGIMDPDVPGLTGSFALANFGNMAQTICTAVLSVGGTPDDCVAGLAPLAGHLDMGIPPAGLSPLVRDSRSNVEPGNGVWPGGVMPQGEATGAAGSAAPSSNGAGSSNLSGVVSDLLSGGQ